ncbi:hypothetical protein QZH41_001867 [Actinostola sp. cb2023]|nr:hypothetical protein QZH41_001867 [Actinostola sp. cb2023]
MNSSNSTWEYCKYFVPGTTILLPESDTPTRTAKVIASTLLSACGIFGNIFVIVLAAKCTREVLHFYESLEESVTSYTQPNIQLYQEKMRTLILRLGLIVRDLKSCKSENRPPTDEPEVILPDDERALELIFENTLFSNSPRALNRLNNWLRLRKPYLNQLQHLLLLNNLLKRSCPNSNHSLLHLPRPNMCQLFPRHFITTIVQTKQ